MRDNSQSPIGIRDITSIEEMGAVEELQREVWRCADVDVVPRMMMHPACEVGGVLVGAYDGARLVGFAFGFVGLERGRLVLHSHMLAVHPAYRARRLGYLLKLTQRERALAQGITIMTWTFDPLQSRNAHLNFTRLGVVSDSYRLNYYGSISTSPLHGATGTDRLWVTWRLDSPRVVRRIDETRAVDDDALAELERAAPLVSLGADGSPVDARRVKDARGGLISIELPGDIDALRQEDTERALRWRVATRIAFLKALSAGYGVEEFVRVERDGRRVGAYLLRRMIGEGQGD
jgi:predicted GNAT superfamily acetyltransferase